MRQNSKRLASFGIASMLVALATMASAKADDIARFDGVYAGPMTLERTGLVGKKKCDSGIDKFVTVKGGKFQFPFNPSLGSVVEGTVTDSGLVAGQVHAAGTEASIKAQLDGDTLTGEGGSGYCYYSFVMKKKKANP